MNVQRSKSLINISKNKSKTSKLAKFEEIETNLEIDANSILTEDILNELDQVLKLVKIKSKSKSLFINPEKVIEYDEIMKTIKTKSNNKTFPFLIDEIINCFKKNTHDCC